MVVLWNLKTMTRTRKESSDEHDEDKDDPGHFARGSGQEPAGEHERWLDWTQPGADGDRGS